MHTSIHAYIQNACNYKRIIEQVFESSVIVYFCFHCKDLREGASYVESKPDMTQIATFLRPFLDKLATLLPGKRMVVPGGWSKKSGGHAIMHTVEREATPEAHYAFVITNTGHFIV
jgi:hypothetical protein